MKKAICCVALVMALLLCACGHSHTAAGDWQRDAAEHWKVCEYGEKFDVASHELDDMGQCQGCGAELTVWDDGTDLFVYDQQGNLVLYCSYGPDGALSYEERIDFTYDAAGNVLTEKRYNDGVLSEESVYQDGVLSSMVTYDADARHEFTLNEFGDPVSMISYDTAGNVIGEEYTEYAYTEDGEYYAPRTTTIDADGSKYVSEYNPQGDQIIWITYTPDGAMDNNERYEYTYDEEGHKTAVKVYSFDALVQEKLYTMVVFEDGWMNYPGTIIDYHEDGGKTVCVYDENDELVSETHYDADGNVIE